MWREACAELYKGSEQREGAPTKLEARQALRDREGSHQGQHGSIENKYAQALLEAGEFTQSTLPAPKYVFEIKTKTKSSEQHLPSASASTTKLLQFDRPGSEFDAVAVITYADILSRLRVSNLPAEVSLRNLDFLDTAQLSQVLSMGFEGAGPILGQ